MTRPKKSTFTAIGKYRLTPRGRNGAVVTVPIAWLDARGIDRRDPNLVAVISATDSGPMKNSLLVEFRSPKLKGRKLTIPRWTGPRRAS